MGIIRLFLALVVALGHSQAMLLTPIKMGFDDFYMLNFTPSYAVFFFYVISGFLITYTLLQNYDRTSGGSARFYINRFIRIFSLYWPVILLVMYFSQPARTIFAS